MTTKPKSSRLSAPEQLTIVKMTKPEVAEMIEKYICYVDPEDRPVHLQSHFVDHYMRRDDGALPTLQAIAQLPIVLYDGTVLGGHDLDRKYGIFFAIPEELDGYLPKIEDCTPGAVAESMQYLTDHWLVDVAANYQAKCTLIAAELTIIEQALLPQRPAFFVTAGKRGGGKTTTVHMLSMAATGLPAAAAAWSTHEEERRKALFAYLGAGLRMIVWDNLARGATISCPSIEKALTSEFYTDRILGETDHRIVPAYTVQFFIGNNIAPKGDLVSRSLIVRLILNTPEPENRTFSRPGDPIAWTNMHRGEILQAFYTILLGNPRRRQKPDERAPAPTRFKEWWEMVGSAVEYAAAQHAEAVHWQTINHNKSCSATPIDFKKIFLAGEADDDQENSLATVLEVLRARWPKGCQAKNVASYASREDEASIEFAAALEAASGKPLKSISSTTVAWRLKAIADAPINVGGEVLVLRYQRNHEGATFTVKPAA